MSRYILKNNLDRRANTAVKLLLILLLGPFLFSGCRGCGGGANSGSSFPGDTSGNNSGKDPAVSRDGGGGLRNSAFPWIDKGKTIDGKPIAAGIKGGMRIPGDEFNRKYSEGLKKMDDEDLGGALQIFEEIVKNYPGSDEASMAEYRIAMIHFKNKANNLALQAYKKIVQDYPSSPVAENAQAAINYLETIGEHEKNYISPDIEDQKRRGW